MSVSTEYVIETQGLTKTYKGVQAVRSLDLQVHQNSICGFLGPNGAGKTTTIKLLLGLAQPTGGSGRVFGKDIVRENDEIRRRVGYLPHQGSLVPILRRDRQAVKPGGPFRAQVAFDPDLVTDASPEFTSIAHRRSLPCLNLGTVYLPTG